MRSWSCITLFVAIAVVDGATIAEARERLVASAVIDLALTEDGRLIGRCQDHDGQNVASAAVDLSQDGALVARVRSRADGTFVFPDLSEGVYELSTAEWRRPVRIWTAANAPPASKELMVILLNQAIPPSKEQSRWNEFAIPRESEERAESPESEATLAAWSEPAPLMDDEAGMSQAPEHGTNSPFPPDSYEGTTIAQADDPAFYPFDNTMEAPQPVPEIVDAGGPVQPQTFSPPQRYSAGPTIGEVVTTATVITSVVIGAVAIHEVGELRDRIKRVASP